MNKAKIITDNSSSDIHYNALKKLQLIFGFEIHRFSNSHWRIVGFQTIDYWPTTHRYWIRGARCSVQGSLAEIANLAMMEKPNHLAGKRTGGIGHVYSGRVPPWHESLGEYREFTATEKSESSICKFYK